MAKRNKGLKVRATAADRAKSGARSRNPFGSAPRGAGQRSKGFGEVNFEKQVSGRGNQRGREQGGLIAGARDIAQNVGHSTRQAAEATMQTARGFASGAADAAGSVANAAGSVANKVKENPWPTLLIGAGATWLAVEAIRGRSNEGGSARQRAHDFSRSRRGRQRGAVSQAVETGRAAVSQAVSTSRGAVGQAMSKVADAGRAAGGQIEDFVRERPFLAGAATLGIGMAVGMALPSSVTENEMLGQARDKVVRRAKAAAQETMDKVRDVSETIERIGPFGASSRRRNRG